MFCAAIGLPLLYIATDRSSKFPFPTTIGDIFFLPRETKFYFAHDFPPRHALTRLHRKAMSGLLGEQTEFGEVILGNNGWMFLGPALFNGDLPQGILRERLETHERRAQFCQQLGISYYVVPAPAKENLYVEHLPIRLQRFIDRSLEVTQLQRYLSTKSDDINCVYLLNRLRKWKTKGKLFFKTDVHWNDLGAFAASQEAMRQILPDLGFPPPPRNTPYDISFQKTPGGNEAQILGIRNKVEETYPELKVLDGRNPTLVDGRPIKVDAINFLNFDRTGVHTVCPEGEIASGMVFHDSFGAALAPFLGRYFKSCSFYWQEFSDELVRKKRPLVIIDLVNTF